MSHVSQIDWTDVSIHLGAAVLVVLVTAWLFSPWLGWVISIGFF